MRRVRFALSAALLGLVSLSLQAGSPPLTRAGTPSMRARSESLRSSSTDVAPIWSYTVFGTGIGYGNVLLGRAGGRTEIYVNASTWSAGPSVYWYALAYTPSTGNYDQVFVSEPLSTSIVRMGLADVTGDSSNEIVVALLDGEIRLYDEETKRSLTGFSTVPDLEAMTLADLDGDGKSEVIVTTSDGLYVYSGTGALLWSVPGVGGNDVAVGQMDLDPALEVATTSGDVVDSATHTVQWHWPDGFGTSLRAGDVDGDGIDELVAASGWIFVWAYDVERQLPKWSIPASNQDISTIALYDVNCDGRLDLIVGEGQWGSIKAWDTVSQQLIWAIGNPEHGVTQVAIGDVDGDGLDDVLWGAGATSSGPDRFFVGDPRTQSIRWSSMDLVGPLVGPEVGDIDGDGQPELVAVSSLSDSGYGGGRILVFDARTRMLRAISDPVTFGFFPVEDLRLADIDGDGTLEILLATNYLYDGQATAFKFDGATNTFTKVWTSAVAGNSPFYSVAAADADGDGQLDILAGASGTFSFVYVFDAVTGLVKWNSFLLGGNVRDVLVESAGGGHPDIVAIVDGGKLYAFDGVTKEALQITPGTFSVMVANTASASRSVYLGDTSGTVYRYDRGPATYVLAATYPLGLASIDGITVLAGGGFVIGAGGRLYQYPSLSGPAAWSSADLGAPAGRHVVTGAAANARYFTGSALSVVEVAPGSALASVVPGSGPASGGTTLTVTGTAFEAGAGLFVGDAAATNAGVDGSTQIHGDTPPMPPGTLQTVLVLNPDSSFESLERTFFADFLDVAAGSLFHDDVETIVRHGVSAGCGAGNYCGSNTVSRAQMAVFLVRAASGPDFQPPRATGQVFSDVVCSSFASREIEHIARIGVTAGCGGGAYCPSSPVTRAQMAVFLLKALLGSGYVPPPATGLFGDVPASDPFAPWIEDLAGRGITAGCGGGNFCPDASTTRGQMAALLNRTFFAP